MVLDPALTLAIDVFLTEDGHAQERSLLDIEYARLLTEIANYYGYPVDTEWALDDSQFQVLQSRPITTLAEEYDQPIIEFPDEWQRIARRPMSLLEVSIFSHWLDSEHTSKMGIVENRVLSIQDDAGMAINFWPAPAVATAMEHIHELYQHERPRLIAMLQQGQSIYDDARQQIERSASVRRIKLNKIKKSER